MVPDLSTKGILIEVDLKGFAYRIIGELSIKLALIIINLNAIYSLTS